jgi:hypothetical protein
VEETIRFDGASREDVTEYLDENATSYETTDDEPLRATGPMNGGGPALEFETSGGSIRIRTDGS